jgi:hypothetical protein
LLFGVPGDYNLELLHQLVAMIFEEERELLGHLQTVTRDLARRIAFAEHAG